MFIRSHLDLANIDYNKIILYGMHVGHSFINSVFYSAWLVYSYTQNILIINLFKTLRGFRSGLTSIIAAVNTYNPIWFINLDQSASISIKFLAMSCGEFSATSFWINGFISNYISIYNTYYKLKKISWFAYPTRNKNVNDSYNFWYFTRCTWPRTSFISNVSCSYQPAKESSYLGIPCLGIVDTNTYTHVVSIPIPGSDDSIDCLVFYNSYISKFILLRKNTLILYWYFSTRKIKRFSSFKFWLRKMNHLKFDNFNKSKQKLISNIKFRFDLLKNIKLGMHILFSQNSKYNLKNFEYLDIFKYYKRENFKGIAALILKKKNLYRVFKSNFLYLKSLKKLYFNKKLWTIYYVVKKKFFRSKYFQFNLFSKNYFKKNIKSDRFYKTHLRWTAISNIFATKLYKFFIIYNFLKFKKLSTIIFDKQLLDSIYLKLIINQVFINNKNSIFYLNKNKILSKNRFNLFYFKNIYKFYKIQQKKILLTNLFLLLNKNNWMKFIRSKRFHYIEKIKFLSWFYKIKKKIFIKKISSFLTFLIKKKFKFIKFKFKLIKFYNIYLNFFKNLNILYKKYSKQFSKPFNKKIIKKRKKNKKSIYYFFKKNKYLKYLKYTKYFRFLFIKKIKHIKYHLYVHKFLFFMKNILNNDQWNKYKMTIYLFINIFFINKKYKYNFFYNFFKKIIFNIFWFYILPNIKYYIFFFKNKYNYLYYNIIKNYNNIKYKQLYKKNNNNINLLNLNYKNLINIKFNFKNMKVNNKKKIKKINIYLFLFIFLNNINYKKIKNKLKKKKNISFYQILKNSYLNKLLKKLDDINYDRKNKQIYKYKKKKNKTISLRNRYSLYNVWLFKHPFFNIIKYEYFLYLKNNPYNINSINYYNYLNYDNFIKWKRKKLINNSNWSIFLKYSSNNVTELFKDIFIRFKILYLKKNIYKNIYNISLFYLLNKKKIFKKYKYFLGWFNFNISLKLKDWFYQKDFFLFPTWFYNYKKKKNYYFNISSKKKIFNDEYERIKTITLKKNIIRFKLLNFILKSLLFFFKTNTNNLHKKNILINNFLLFRHNLKIIIMNTIFDYASIFWNVDYPQKFKDYMLNIKIFQLNQLFSLIYKRYYLNKIRFNRKIHDWNIKKDLINIAQINILNSLNDKNKIKLEIEILSNKHWFTKFMKNNKIKKYRKFWKNRIKYDKKILKYLYKFEKIKNIKNTLIEKENLEKKNKIQFLKEKKILKSFFKYSTLFNKKYNNNIINNYQIGSSLNNLFYKFYNIPRFLFYKQIKIYLKNYKIILRNKNYKKNFKNNIKSYNHLKLLNKNYNNNIIINLSKFLKMYGFKWL